jgi:hypothetical protein
MVLNRLGAPLLVLAALIGGATAAIAETEQADDFLIVDCLLPAQIRQLGQHMTFLAPRQPIRTSGHECALRGGEFSHDGLGGAAGLQIWLPQAQKGDATAQLYVGEIFERGLAGRPDYAAAAVWYRRAADQDNAKAQIALGALLEQGQGVPRDPVAAEKLFRRAAGLPENMPESDNERVAALSSQLAAAKASDASSRRQLERQSEQLRRLRRQLDQRESAVQRDRDRLSKLQRDLDASRQRAEAGGGTASASEASQDLVAREQEVARSHQLINQLNAKLAMIEKDRQSADAQIDALRREIGGARSAVAGKENEVDRLRRQLREAEHGNEARDQTTQKLAETLEARERDLADSKTQANRLRDQLAALETTRQTQQKQKSNREADQLRRERDAARQSMTSQQAELEHLRSELKQTRQSGTGREKELRGRVERQQHDIEALKNKIAAQDGDIGRLKQQFAGNETERGTATIIAAPPPFPVSEFGTYHALVIGIDHYRRLPVLDTPINDANDVANELKQAYHFDVVTLLDADRYQILSALNHFRQTLTQHDNLLIYYAGHGELDRVNQRGNWLPVDAEGDNTANWISNVQITDMLNNMAARQILVVADSCYSGTLTRGVATAISRTQGEAERVKWYKIMISKPSRVALTSGGLEPVADSGGGRHSMFAKLFLQVLQNNASVIAARELYDRIQPAVATASNNFTQVPEYAPIKLAGHEAGDFLFVRRNSAAP